MGISDWRAKKHMRYPERGVLRVTGFYDAHPHSSPSGTRITGVITAPGIPATAVEHKADGRGRWAGVQELPVLVDRAEPSRFVILWDELQPVSWRDQEMQAAQAEADRINAGPPRASVTVTFGSAGAQAFGQAISQAMGQVAAPHGGFQPAEAARFLASGGGEQASAVVLAAQDVPGPPAPGGTVDLTLQVTRANGSVYTTPTRISFSTPERRAAITTPGTRLKVRIDPNVPARIAIDPAGLF
jgi:hypothetical protein